MNSNTTISREDFLIFFRDDEKLNLLTPDDRIEIFSQILLGSSDVTRKLLETLIDDYNVEGIAIIEGDNRETIC
jgi:hypothetical protein